MNLKSSTLHEWLTYISKIHPKTIDMTLTRVKAIAERLYLFPFEPYTITIAGTNGKGTTTGFLEHAYREAGYHVAMMTSPHLLRFNERLRIHGQELSDDEICAAFERIENIRQDISLTYFEYVTLAGLYLFKQAKVEIALLEVGLGGRLDAVNIIDPHLAIITSIDLDHTEYLGPDRESIGYEKAGILRPNIPLVFGDEEMPESVKRLTKRYSNRVYQRGKDYETISYDSHIPIENVANAVQAITVLQGKFPVKKEIIDSTIANFRMPGRFQVINTPFTHIYDVAHNPHGMLGLKKFLSRLPSSGKTYAIFSMLRTKDINTCLERIKNSIDHWHIAPLQDALGLALESLKTAFAQASITHYTPYDSIASAYNTAAHLVQPKDRLVIFGSFHTVAEVMQEKV